jgi:hypothetical protein
MRREFLEFTRSRETVFGSRKESHKSLSCAPTNRDITSKEQTEIMKQNREDFRVLRERCG